MTQTSTPLSPTANRASSRLGAVLFAFVAMATFWLPTLTNPAEAQSDAATVAAMADPAPATVIVIASIAAPVLM